MNHAQIRNEYNELIQRLSSELNDLDFDLSITASRNPHQTKVFSSMLENKNIVRDKFHSRIFQFIKLVTKLFIAHLILTKNDAKKSSYKNKKIILLDTYVIPSMINGGSYNDRYYTGFSKFISKEKADRCYYLPTLEGRFSLRDKINTQYICKESFLKFSDYFYACTYCLRIKKVQKKIKSINWIPPQVKSNIQAEISNSSFRISSILSILMMRFIKRLEENNIDIELVIDWNENQTIDRALNKALSIYYPDTIRKGYQGFCIDPFINFHLAPTQYEVESNYTPNQFLILGPALQDYLKEFYERTMITTGPALRFSHLFSKLKTQKKIQQILVGLPISVSESLHIVSLVEEVADQLPDHRFLIKPHPSSSLKIRLAKNNIQLTFLSTGELLEQSSLLISISSSICLEALTKFTGVIIVAQNNSINSFKNTMPKNLENLLWSQIYTSKDLQNSIFQITEYIETNSEKASHTSQILLSQYFTEPTESSVNKMFSPCLSRNNSLSY